MVYIIKSKNKRTPEMKARKEHFHAEFFPEEARVYDKLQARRRKDQPIDGRCFKDAGLAVKELQEKRFRARDRK